MAFKKIDQFFVLSDSSVNVYGYRLLTSGYKIGEFLKNPIGYYGHKYDDGVLLKWEDVQLQDDKVIGKPVINMEHPRAERTVSEIENGFLNAASVGKVVIEEYELEDNPEDPEHPRIVGAIWYNKECSLVDSPGNRGAFKLEDVDGNELNLADVLTNILKSKADMKKVTLEITPELIGLLNLSDSATGEDVLSGIKGLRTENGDLAEKVGKLETELADQAKAVNVEKVKQILDRGEAEKRFTAETRKKLEARFGDAPTELEDLVKTMPVYKGIVDHLSTEGVGDLPKELADKTYDELDRKNLLPMLKEKYPNAFAEKFKSKFGRMP